MQVNPEFREAGDSETHLVAIAGNPNTGKTTLFNRLTGARRHVGNYPGVTVEKKEGRMLIDGEYVPVIDLPGAYSLSAHSADERVAVDMLCGRIPGIPRPSLVVCVVDGTNLERNLFLPTQIVDTGLPLVIALNMHDEVRKKGFEIDCDNLSRRLNVPVIPIVARSGEGMDALRKAIGDSLREPSCMTPVSWPGEISRVISGFRSGLNGAGSQVKDAEIHRLLFDRDPKPNPCLTVPHDALLHLIDTSHRNLRDNGVEPYHAEALFRFGWIDGIVEGALRRPSVATPGLTAKIDKVLTGRVSGLLAFPVLMYLVFQSIYTLASPFMKAIDSVLSSISESAAALLAGTPVLQSFVIDGVIAGAGGVVIFLPQILILFFFIAILEDTGYMARAAFMMDKVFGWCGLNGKSFVPLLSGYACGVPGVMAARTIEDAKARLCTILTAPLMSCSARLPIYVLFTGAFIEPSWGPSWAAFTLLAMHLLGLLLALPVAFLINRFILRSSPQPFVLEMPPYRMPRWRDIAWRLYDRGKTFLLRAGTVICCMSMIIWALSYFPRDASVETSVNARLVQQVSEEKGVDADTARAIVDTQMKEVREHRLAAAYLEGSFIGSLGKAVQPLFSPAGFDWKATVAILASFPAREVAISTLGILYNLGGGGDEHSTDLKASLQSAVHPDGSKVFTIPVTLSLLVFFALCMQCGATLAVIARESSWKWSLFAFSYMTVLAWGGAVVVYQLTSSLMQEHRMASHLELFIIIICLLFSVVYLYRHVRRRFSSGGPERAGKCGGCCGCSPARKSSCLSGEEAGISSIGD